MNIFRRKKNKPVKIMGNKIYIAKYSSGSYDDYGEWDVYAFTQT